MEPNGVGTQTQNLSVAPHAQVMPQQQQQAPPQQPNQIAGTPYQVVNPGQQTQVQQPAQQPQTNQQPTLQDLRQQIAQATGYSIDQVPSDPNTIAQIVLGGLGAQAKLQQYLRQGTPQATPALQQPAANPLQQVQMPPGWEGMVTRNQQGVYEPNHPAFSQVAQLANQNYAVQQMRQNAVQAGNLLPEHEQKIEQMVQQRLHEQLELQRQHDFIEQRGQELFQHDAGGNRQTAFNPQSGKMEPVMSEFGLAFNAAAEELHASGAQFPSKHALAQLAYRLAKERARPAANANGSQQNGPPSQVVNPDLAALFTQHTANNTQRHASVNGSAPMTGNPSIDLRSTLRNVFATLPAVAPGTEYARALGFNV